ncbi:MAG: daunorubicin resistance transporter ATPase subunit [Actinotalea sp.]|nr:daunorubicin resistance transporter ATPase subunit [Actinotalea sp.]
MDDDRYALDAHGIHKQFGETSALDGFDLVVEAGTVHGLLGPNGAGKSTAVKVLTTLIAADSGTAHVAGYDVRTQGAAVRRRIGLVGQTPAVDEILGGRQNLVMFGRLFGLDGRRARNRADELLRELDLLDAADRVVSTYSGGMRRKLDIAAGLILTPAVLFLDEPTSGLDPRARNDVWQTVRRIASEGTTVLLTTQYLDEADQLASRVSVMARGRVIAEGTPEDLKRKVGGDRVTVTLPHGAPVETIAAELGAALGAATTPDVDAGSVTVELHPARATLTDVVRALDAHGLRPEDLAVRRPTLDEAFLALTATGARR